MFSSPKYIFKHRKFTQIFEICRNASRAYRVLGIETTCDDTGVAIVDTNRHIIAESKRNQWLVHKSKGFSKQTDPNNYSGGIIPNVARDMHYYNLIDCVYECIEQIECDWDSIDAISLAVKPGLAICLWEGFKFTRQLLEKYKKPFIPIHHMEAHALTARLFESDLEYPFVSLLVSGAHSILVLVKDSETFIRLGDGIDLAPGNCIDRVARSLGLFEISKNNAMSGGALVEQFARNGDVEAFPQIIKQAKHFCGTYRNCDFSFSGLHSVMDSIIKNLRKDSKITDKNLSDLCAGLQNAIAYQLSNRLKIGLVYLRKFYEDPDLLKCNKPIDVVVAGGVGANKFIFESLQKTCAELNARVVAPPLKYCTDNGVMIAWNGCEKILSRSKDIVSPYQQTKDFFDTFKCQAQCELGLDISEQINEMRKEIKMGLNN